MRTFSFKQLIPNLITSANLLCGCFSILAAFSNQFEMAAIFILLAAVFDFIDGLVARLLHATSELGKQLDSLADVVSFGVAPGFLMFHLVNLSVVLNYQNSNIFWLPYTVLIIPVLSAWRLAKFNIDERQSVSFRGLPTPANAILLSSFPLILFSQNRFHLIPYEFYLSILLNPYFLVIVCWIMSLLLVSEIQLFSLKLKSYTWKENKVRYLFLAISILLFLVFYLASIPFIVFLYLVLSIGSNLLCKQKNITESII